MAKVGKFYLPIYAMNYFFFIGQKHDDINAYCLKTFGLGFESGPERGKCIKVENDTLAMCLIYVADKRDIVAMAHECLHAANFTLQNVGIKISTGNDEIQTYLFDVIFEQALKHSQKTNRLR